MWRLGCNGFTFTLRERPSRSPLDGDITELMRDTLAGGDFIVPAIKVQNINLQLNKWIIHLGYTFHTVLNGKGNLPSVLWHCEDCQERKLNKEDAMDRCKWRKVIKEARWSGRVWVGECFFWYRPTRVVPDQRPLNGRCCCFDTVGWAAGRASGL